MSGTGKENLNSEEDFAELRDAVMSKTVEICQKLADGSIDIHPMKTRERSACTYCEYKGIDVSIGEFTNILSYADVSDISSWAMEAMQWACGSGVIEGIAKNDTLYLEPQGDAIRSQSATMIFRFSTEIME